MPKFGILYRPSQTFLPANPSSEKEYFFGITADNQRASRREDWIDEQKNRGKLSTFRAGIKSWKRSRSCSSSTPRKSGLQNSHVRKYRKGRNTIWKKINPMMITPPCLGPKWQNYGSNFRDMKKMPRNAVPFPEQKKSLNVLFTD